MNRKTILMTIVLLVFVFIQNFSHATDNPAAKETALKQAKSWLTLVDDGKYTQSWKESAEYFKTAISKDKWKEMIGPVRKPLGKTLSRKLKSETYYTSLPGVPDGEYYVIQFDTSFQNKKSALETITPMLEKDGQWRVSGYYIK